MKSFVKTGPDDLVRTYIDLASVLYFPESDWLRMREKEFLVTNVVLRAEGLDLKSTDAVDEIKNRMNFSSRDDVYNYRNKLKKKGWLVQTKDSIILPPLFNRFKKVIPDKIRYSFSLEI
jgi:hypothetical protein